MKVTEELLQKADQIQNFSDGIIMPDGDYRLIEENGHLQTMMALLPYPEKEIWKMIPENDSALFWMIERTGCVLTDYNSTVGMAMTPEQKEIFDCAGEAWDYFSRVFRYYQTETEDERAGEIRKNKTAVPTGI